MLWGIAFLAIVTAAITSVFVARAQQERAAGESADAAGARATVDDRFNHVDAQLQAAARAAREDAADVLAPPAGEQRQPERRRHREHELHRLAAAELRLAARARAPCPPAPPRAAGPASTTRISASTSGAPLVYGSASSGSAFAFTA